MLEDLSVPYMYDQNGELDKFITHTSNCFVKCIYGIMKARPKGNFEPFNLFLEDITPRLLIFTRSDSITEIRIEATEYGHDNTRPLFEFKKYKNQDSDDSLSLLENLLDEGNIVIIHPWEARFPNLVFYRPELDDSSFEEPECGPGSHVFLIVWHDKENIYYVDEPRLINTKYFISHEDNKSIGIIKKQDFIKYTRKFVEYITVKVREDAEFNNKANTFLLEKTLSNYHNTNLIDKRSVTNYYGPERGYVTFDIEGYCGFTALEKVLGMCREPSDNYIFAEFGPADQDILRLPTTRRGFLLEWLKIYSHDASLYNIAEKCLQKWKEARNVLVKRKYQGKISSSTDLVKYFENIYKYEELLVEEISKNINKFSRRDITF